MFDFLRRIYKKPTATVIAVNDLEEAQRQLLTHQAAETYHAKMTEYYQETVDRLSTYLNKVGE
jgi:hypothetical protein